MSTRSSAPLSAPARRRSTRATASSPRTPTFARACADAGIVFIGPSPDAIATMGDKITAKLAVAERGRADRARGSRGPGFAMRTSSRHPRDVGYPLLIKPSAGGGGKGMHVVESAGELAGALAAARREAAASFGDDTLFLERYVQNPRHIEVQILADAHGSVVHLGERECSLQRRHQKVIEEAPSPLLDARRASADRGRGLRDGTERRVPRAPGPSSSSSRPTSRTSSSSWR